MAPWGPPLAPKDEYRGWASGSRRRLGGRRPDPPSIGPAGGLGAGPLDWPSLCDAAAPWGEGKQPSGRTAGRRGALAARTCLRFHTEGTEVGRRLPSLSTRWRIDEVPRHDKASRSYRTAPGPCRERTSNTFGCPNAQRGPSGQKPSKKRWQRPSTREGAPAARGNVSAMPRSQGPQDRVLPHWGRAGAGCRIRGRQTGEYAARRNPGPGDKTRASSSDTPVAGTAFERMAAASAPQTLAGSRAARLGRPTFARRLSRDRWRNSQSILLHRPNCLKKRHSCMRLMS